MNDKQPFSTKQITEKMESISKSKQVNAMGLATKPTMVKPSPKGLAWLLVLVLATAHVNSFGRELPDSKTKPTEKQLYLPAEIFNVPKNNDFQNDTSKYCFKRMKESENVAIFWAKEYGDAPMANPNVRQRFNVDEILNECERAYNFYVDDLKFIEKGRSITDRYKCLIFIIDSIEGTAFGGGEENKVGMFWAPAARMSKAPFGALAHELGHSFQYLLGADKAALDTTQAEGGGGSYSFVEMTSQYMLWQVYPEWMTFENYHLVDFMKQTNLAFLHEKNMYHSPYILEYWSNKHGIDFIGKMWRESKSGEDPVMTYKRLTAIDQCTFNNEQFDAARRFVTWDLKRVEQVAKKYANQHFSKLNSLGNGWFQITENKCPQNYGYNAIKLTVPKAGTVVELTFKGIAGAAGYRALHVDKAGWRYGFVAVKENGDRVYGKMFADANGEVKFKVPQKTAHLWLVVSGAPTEHWPHEVDGDEKNDEQWPYQLKLTGTTIDLSNVE
jgi:hypothetical protein